MPQSANHKLVESQAQYELVESQRPVEADPAATSDTGAAAAQGGWCGVVCKEWEVVSSADVYFRQASRLVC